MTMRTHLFVCLFVHQQIILMKGVAWSVIAGQYPGCNSKLFKGEEVRSDTRSFLNLRFETAAIGHTGTKLQYRQPWRGEKHWFYLPHECLFVLLLIYINLNFKQIKIFHKFFNLFQSTWDRWNKTWIGRKAQSRMFWRAITTSSWGDRTVLLNIIGLFVLVFLRAFLKIWLWKESEYNADYVVRKLRKFIGFRT